MLHLGVLRNPLPPVGPLRPLLVDQPPGRRPAQQPQGTEDNPTIVSQPMYSEIEKKKKECTSLFFLARDGVSPKGKTKQGN